MITDKKFGDIDSILGKSFKFGESATITKPDDPEVAKMFKGDPLSGLDSSPAMKKLMDKIAIDGDSPLPEKKTED